MSDTFEILLDDDPTLVAAHGTDTVVEVALVGPPGPIGPGYAPTEYDLTAVSNWTIAHGRTYLPDVWLIDATGALVAITVTYPDAAHLNISVPTPFTGKALVS